MVFSPSGARSRIGVARGTSQNDILSDVKYHPDNATGFTESLDPGTWPDLAWIKQNVDTMLLVLRKFIRYA